MTDLPTPAFRDLISNEFRQIQYEYTGPVGLLLVLVGIGSVGIYSTVRLRNRRASWLAGASEAQVIFDQITELDNLHSENKWNNHLYRDRRGYLLKRLEAISDKTEVE